MPTITPARQILQELETTAIKAKLRALPDWLKAARMEEAVVRQRVADLQRQMDGIEGELTLHVAEERDEKDKPRYSNAELRSAAVARKMVQHDEYLRLRGESRIAQTTLDNAAIRVRQLDEEFSAARVIARIVAGELAVLAGDDTND